MAGTVWTTPEQKEFLETYYSGFLLAQLQAKVPQYWDPIYYEWFKIWPEEDVVCKNTPASNPRTDKENTVLGAALQKRRQVSTALMMPSSMMYILICSKQQI